MTLFGDQRDIEKPQRYATPSLNLVTDDLQAVFRARTRPFSLDSIVTQAATVSAARARDVDALYGRLRAAGLNPDVTSPFLLRRVVTEAILGRDLPDHETGFMSGVWFIQAATTAMDRVALADRASRQGENDGVDSLVMRILQLQYHDQLGLGDYERELSLALRTIAAARAQGYDVEMAYEQQLGLTFSQLAVLSFGAFASLLAVADGEPPLIDSKSWCKTSTSPFNIPPPRVGAFFDACSAGYSEYQTLAANPAVRMDGYEGYGLSPLLIRPLLRRSDDLLVAPVLGDTLERATRAFPVEGLRIADAAGGRRTASQFSGALGSVYEDYVGEILSAASPAATTVRGDSVFRRDSKQCDFVTKEEHVVVLVEVKAVRLRLQADMTKQRSILTRELGVAHGVADGVIQLNESARAIREGETDLNRNSNLIGLLVVRGEQVFLNSEYVREILDEIVLERTGKKPLLRYQIANDAGLLRLAQYGRDGGSIGQWLYRKSRSEGRSNEFRSQWDLHLAFPRETGGVPFSLPGQSSAFDNLLESHGIVLPTPE